MSNQEDYKEWWESQDMELFKQFLLHNKAGAQEILDSLKAEWAANPYTVSEHLASRAHQANTWIELIDTLLSFDHVEQWWEGRNDNTPPR